MKYVGSKDRHAKEILDAMLKEIGSNAWDNTQYENWIEPFVGGANMIAKVPRFFSGIYGADINPYVIAMFQAVQKGWVPPDSVSEEEYQRLKTNSEHFIEDEAPLRGFVGIGCSYSGKWFGGYARGNANNGQPRNYCLESKKNLLKQKPNIIDVKFICSDYRALTVPINGLSIIYCDPPYENTTKYLHSIQHKDFWDWCEAQSQRGHKVFVSEYQAPEGWRCIWQKEVNNSLTKETGSKQGIEKLFTK